MLSGVFAARRIPLGVPRGGGREGAEMQLRHDRKTHAVEVAPYSKPRQRRKKVKHAFACGGNTMSISEASGRELCRAAGDVGAPQTGAGRFAHVGGGVAALAARHPSRRREGALLVAALRAPGDAPLVVAGVGAGPFVAEAAEACGLAVARVQCASDETGAKLLERVALS